VYYETYGKGEPLLLLHGGSASIESWFEQIPVFAGGFRVIAVDTRGHGRTEAGDRPLSYAQMTEDFAGLLKHLNITNVSIMGWSDGGVAGLEMAIRYPGLVKKLVTAGANYQASGITDEIREGVKASGPEDHPGFLVELYKKLSPDGPDHWPVAFGNLKKLWLNEPNISETDLAKIKCPTLITVGDHDIVKPEHTLKMFQTIPNARLFVVPGTTHYVLLEKPKLWNETVFDFLKEPVAL